ncbi:unnamed protein product [Parascedosporium putredinis]|uniref:tetrahydrofolate synthase n=1 Tax=Parascedosporium putredinis TaxID=1442378 RepID=A0A9P1H9L9_9PEZI|nr:unnamed protein product [Parascedosporium putredinis]CAI8001850.1 unnamed protein product [Parascedosporium putredinis]
MASSIGSSMGRGVPSLPISQRLSRRRRTAPAIGHQTRQLSIQGRTYDDALKLLDTLKSNAATTKLFNASSGGISGPAAPSMASLNARAIPEMREWLARAGYSATDLAQQLRCVHVAGTKGKGSTCAYTAAILRKAPLSSGTEWGGGGGARGAWACTSPHLVSVRERIEIDGAPVGRETFARRFFEVWDTLDAAAAREGAASDGATRPFYFRCRAGEIWLPDALAGARLRGRGQVLVKNGARWHLDGAHTEDSDAIGLLNSTQAGFRVLEDRKRVGWIPDSASIAQMKEWLRMLGYTRIQLNGTPISEPTFAAAFFHVWRTLGLDRNPTTSPSSSSAATELGGRPTYFRMLTLVSLHVFLTQGVDAAVYEVGVGGEYDATNVFGRPAAAGIASLGIDHVGVLGSTLPEIAWHKAGVIKAGSPAFAIAPQADDAMAVLEARARDKGVSLTRVGGESGLAGVELRPDEDFQRGNASLAVHLAAAVMRRFGVAVDARAGTLPREVVEGIESNSPCALVFNQQSDRDAVQMLTFVHNRLATGGTRIKYAIFSTNITYRDNTTRPEMVNTNVDPEVIRRLTLQNTLADAWRSLDPRTEVVVAPSIEDAIAYIRGREDDELQVFVTGSFHLVGGALSVLEGAGEQ